LAPARILRGAGLAGWIGPFKPIIVFGVMGFELALRLAHLSPAHLSSVKKCHGMGLHQMGKIPGFQAPQ